MKTISQPKQIPNGSLQRRVRLCVVCGARVRNRNPATMTCDPTCTAARNAGRTRPEQQRWEMDHPSDGEIPSCLGCGMYVSQCQCWDAVNSVS